MSDYRRLFNFSRPYFGLLILSGVFMGLVTFFDVFRLSAIVPVVDRVFTNKPIILTNVKLPSILDEVIIKLNNLAPLKVLYLLLIVMPLGLSLRAVFEFLQSYIMSDVGQRVVRDVRSQIYAKTQNLSLDYFTQKRSGELVSRITNDVRLIENAVSYALTDLVYQVFQVFAFMFLTFWINWKMALISVIVAPLVSTPIILIGRVLRRLSKKSQERMADINSLLVETFSGIRIVKAFCMENKEISRFASQNQDYYKLTMKSIKRTLILGIGTELISVFIALLIVFYGGRGVLEGRISFGLFALFMASLLSMIRPFKKLSQVNSIVQQAIAASGRIYEVLDTQPTVKDAPAPKEINSFSKDIVFEDVSFSYGSQSVLEGINLEIKRGEVLAIVGPSGVGKTTLVDLILRFYDPQRGKILIDGRDLRELSTRSLRQLIGIVTQEVILFNDTIKANIAYGRPQAQEAEIRQAAQDAYADEFILRLPLGYNTVIGERGMKLSGGERQRIAIARALLKNPPILILDEATSQLDSGSERIVQQALEKLMRARTVFVIAHRLSTIRNTQRIIVLDKGRIVEEGSHDKLIGRAGLYERLYQTQELER